MRGFVVFLISAMFFFLHILFAPIISIFGAKIDFLMISVLVSAVFVKKWYAPVICGLYSGLITDIFTQAGTFINTGIYLSFAVVAFLAAYFYKERNYITFSVMALIAECLKYFVFVFLLYVMRLSENLTFMTFVKGIPTAIYTSVAALGIYFLMEQLFSCNFMRERFDEDGRFIK